MRDDFKVEWKGSTSVAAKVQRSIIIELIIIIIIIIGLLQERINRISLPSNSVA